MPWEKPNYRRTKTELPPQTKPKIDKMEEFKKFSKAIDNDMDRVLKNHKKNPEKHPQYNDEWKKFWNKRYKELQAEAKDVSTHDFKPEWIEFWNKRMIELHQEEVKAKKDALRKRLGVPEEPAPICFKIMGKKKFEPNKNSPNKPVPPSAMPDNDPEVIVIDDRDDESKSSRRSHSPWEEEQPIRASSRVSREKSRERMSRERSVRKYSRSPRERFERERSYDRDYKHKDYRPRERIRIVSELPWEKNKLPSYYKPPAVMRDVTREPVLTPPPVTSVIEEEVDDTEINVVAVLRLLTALEEKLGSLGPKVIDLLAQALAMEKNEANSSENLLDSDINCVMFETVKEKLKGQLLAGLVEPIQEKAFKNAIKKTASLIHIAGERKKEKEKSQSKVDPVKVPGIGTVDKAAIARQIANALILQGKTDVSQGELEQLINAVVGMAEASRKANKPITTASFLEQINKAGSSKEKSPIKETKPEPVVKTEPEKITKDMEGLSDSDLQTLLQNFKDLSTEEQHSLINYLKKLEAREPERVERLRKFVNLGAPKEQKDEKKTGRESPFSNRMGSVNPSVEFEEIEPKKKIEEVKLPIDSDEEDYTFEDVVKAASKNVKEKELEKEREIVEESMKFDKKDDLNLDDTKAIISNIMSNINKNEVAQGNLLGLGQVSSADFAKTLNSIPVNIANLANIVGSVQSMTKASVQPKPVQQYQNRPSVSYGVNYPQNPYQTRPNVTYPIDKNKVSYPNYGIYGQGQQQPPGPAPRPVNPQGFGGNQFGNNSNRNNYNRW